MIKKYLATTILGCLSIPLSFAATEASKDKLAFFKDSHLHIQAKNLWRYVNDASDKDTSARFIQSAWGQGFAVNFKSGYIADTIGFDTSYYGVIKLYANKNFNGRGLFYRTADGHAEGFSKLGQRYLKLKFGDNKTGLKINYGWQELPSFGALTRSYTLSPNTYLGVSSTANWSGFTLKTGYVTSSMNRNSAHKIHFVGVDRAKINGIFATELNYTDDVIKATYFYGQSENYLQRHAIEFSYSMAENWKVNGKVYSTLAMKHYKNMPDTAKINLEKPMDRNAFHYVVDGQYDTANWQVVFGSGFTDAKKAKGLGRYPIHLATHSRGTFNSLASSGSDYMRDQELVLFSNLTHHFSKELSVSFTANYGTFKYAGHRIQTGDISLVGRWKPQHEMLKGLGFFVRIAPVNWSYANDFETPILNKNNRAQRKHSQGVEMYITYDLLLF